MDSQDRVSKLRVLYVDDEDISRKYFSKALKPDYEILTAADADEGWNLIEEAAGEIAVIVSDQRMPGKSGVDLLSKTRSLYPRIIRILTTAYSDLTSAIDAVNDGAIYQYVKKPWDLSELKSILKRATELYEVQMEKDHLLREKLSVLQRIFIADRVQSLGILTVALTDRMRNAVRAYCNYVDQVPGSIFKFWQERTLHRPPDWGSDFGELAAQEGKSIFRLADSIVKESSKTVSQQQSKSDFRQLLNDTLSSPALSESGSNRKVSLEIDPDLPPFPVLGEMMGRCLTILVDSTRILNGGSDRIRVLARHSDSQEDRNILHLQVVAEGSPGPDSDYYNLFSLLAGDSDNQESFNLLFAFLIVHHHGGKIKIHRKQPNGPGFEVELQITSQPTSDSREREEMLDLDPIFRHFQSWGTTAL